MTSTNLRSRTDWLDDGFETLQRGKIKLVKET
jgi:hypothetical protein